MTKPHMPRHRLTHKIPRQAHNPALVHRGKERPTSGPGPSLTLRTREISAHLPPLCPQVTVAPNGGSTRRGSNPDSPTLPTPSQANKCHGHHPSLKPVNRFCDGMNWYRHLQRLPPRTYHVSGARAGREGWTSPARWEHLRPAVPTCRDQGGSRAGRGVVMSTPPTSKATGTQSQGLCSCTARPGRAKRLHGPHGL